MALKATYVLIMMFFSLLFFTATLIWQRRKAVAAIDRAVSLASQATGIPTYRRSFPNLAHELARARRYQRPLSVVVLSLEGEQLVKPERSLVAGGGNGSFSSQSQLRQTSQLVFPLVGPILRDALRESEIVTYDPTTNQYVVLLTESTKAQATQFVQRLTELASKRTLIRLRAGIAEFPVDGLTMEDLVSRAQAACSHHPAGEVSLTAVAGKGN
jgi:GGDEF domain-containing protein